MWDVLLCSFMDLNETCAETGVIPLSLKFRNEPQLGLRSGK